LPALVAAVLLVAAIPAAAHAAPKKETETARAGEVDALLTWNYDAHTAAYSNIRLRIQRAGVVAYDAPVVVNGCPRDLCGLLQFPGHRSLHAVDVDHNGEPEVIVDAWSGGAHCCEIAHLLWWDGTRYRAVDHNFADPGYKLRDVLGNGRLQFLTADPRLEYVFSSFAGSGFPVAVWSFANGRFSDVTSNAPRKLIRRDAAVWYRAWVKSRGKPGVESLGVLAAWAADQYRLGHRAMVLRRLRAWERRGLLRGDASSPYRGNSYIRKLDRYLTRLGYRPG
jgi:hypothetical protein